MSAAPDDAAWPRAVLAARLLALDPHGLGGAWIQAPAGPARDGWLALLRGASPPGAPWRRLPTGTADERLLGGIDLEATLAAGRPVAERGVLASADGGIVVVPMAERLPAGAAARIAAALDAGEIAVAREGIVRSDPARIGVVALDESEPDEAPPPAALLDRLAFHVDLRGTRPTAPPPPGAAARDPAAVRAGPDAIEALCAASAALGVVSVRSELLALRAARAIAALDGRDAVAADDLTLAAELVLAPRATRLPAEAPPPEPPESPPEDPAPDDDETAATPSDRPLDDLVVAAALAAIPPGLLARLKAGQTARTKGDGKSGAVGKSGVRGRPAGLIAGARGGRRLDLVATLRAAAPWQGLRGDKDAQGPRVRVRPSDFRVRRMKPRAQATTIFAVDASGSSALHRLAEAKGAVELLLADCYVRRDRVAVVSFRGARAELLLAPTRSLVRAKRALAGLPGGGGTPLASALDAARELAVAVRRQGGTPAIVLLTDGRANVARDGSNAGAESDALEAARALRAEGARAVLIDTAPRPSARARDLAAQMGAVYVALPQADARSMDRAVRAALA